MRGPMQIPLAPLGIAALMTIGVAGCTPALDPIEPENPRLIQPKTNPATPSQQRRTPWAGNIDEESCAQASRMIYDHCLVLGETSEDCESNSLTAYTACTAGAEDWHIPQNTWL